MARTNEYKSTGGAFDKLADALKEIEDRIEDVKKGEVPEEVQEARNFRHVIADLQKAISGSTDKIQEEWVTLGLDPLYLYKSEEVGMARYSCNINFLHPTYEHVWLTDAEDKDVVAEMLPFIEYRVVYSYEDNRVDVQVIRLETKLNLPEFKSSRKAAEVDLEILKEDAKRVETVSSKGDEAVAQLGEVLNAYCDGHDIPVEVTEESVAYAETEGERLGRMQAEAERARMEAEAEEAARRKAEKEAERKAKADADKERKKREKAESAPPKAPAAASPGPPKVSAKRPESGRVSVPPPAPRKSPKDSIY